MSRQKYKNTLAYYWRIYAMQQAQCIFLLHGISKLVFFISCHLVSFSCIFIKHCYFSRMNANDIQKWKVLKEQDVSPSPWFPILQHTVQMANGRVIDDYFFSPLGDVVQVLALTPANEVILVRQYKHGLGEILLELPGGMCQNGKSLIQSALNELEEEVGVRAVAEDLISLGRIANNPTKTRQITYGYILFNAQFNSVQKLDETEAIEVLTMPAPEVLQQVKDGKIWVTDSMNFILKAALQYPDIFEV
jgi:ADP-ribose pyrophosphatase